MWKVTLTIARDLALCRSRSLGSRSRAVAPRQAPGRRGALLRAAGRGRQRGAGRGVRRRGRFPARRVPEQHERQSSFHGGSCVGEVWSTEEAIS